MYTLDYKEGCMKSQIAGLLFMIAVAVMISFIQHEEDTVSSRQRANEWESILAIFRLWQKTTVYLHSQTSFPQSVLNTDRMGDEEAQPSNF